MKYIPFASFHIEGLNLATDTNDNIFNILNIFTNSYSVYDNTKIISLNLNQVNRKLRYCISSDCSTGFFSVYTNATEKYFVDFSGGGKPTSEPYILDVYGLRFIEWRSFSGGSFLNVQIYTSIEE
jgi:hypothetical protein